MVRTDSRRHAASNRRQINLRVDARLYKSLATVARQERRSVAQTAGHLLERGLRERVRGLLPDDDLPPDGLTTLAREGGAFDWLDGEPDLYDETSGETV